MTRPAPPSQPLGAVAVPVDCDPDQGRWWRAARDIGRVAGLGLELRFASSSDLRAFDASSVASQLAGASIPVHALRLPPLAVDYGHPDRCLDPLGVALEATGYLPCGRLVVEVGTGLGARGRYEVAQALRRDGIARLRAAGRRLLLVHSRNVALSELDSLVDLGLGEAPAQLAIGISVGDLDADHDSVLGQIAAYGELGLLGALYLSNRREGRGGHPIFPLKATDLVLRMGEILDQAVHRRRDILVVLDYAEAWAHLLPRHAEKVLERLR